MVDLHIHSTYSDGLESLDRIVEILDKTGIDTFALADHDCVDGVRELSKPKYVALLKKLDMTLISGIEVSSKALGVNVHILGYGMDIDHSEIASICSKRVILRQQKLKSKLDYLTNHGINLSTKSIEYLESIPNVGKPHIAQCMIDEGFVRDVDEACQKYLNIDKGLEFRLQADEVIRAIHSAGGLAVLAHPYEIIDREGQTLSNMRKIINYLKVIGLDGLEVYYSTYSMDRELALKEIADNEGLLISGGSDFHGHTVKENADIGQLNIDNTAIDDEMITILYRLKK